MERIVRCNVHRLVIVDEECRVEGIISLSDIVVFIVIRQEELFAEEQKLEEQKRQQQSSDEGINVSTEGVDSSICAALSDLEESDKEKLSTDVSRGGGGILSQTLSSPTTSNASPTTAFPGSNTLTTPHSKSPSPGVGGERRERPSLKLFVPPSSAPPLSHQQHRERLLQHQKQSQQQQQYHRSNGDAQTPPPGLGGGSGIEKTPSPIRETYNQYPRRGVSSSACDDPTSMASSLKMMTPPPSSTKGKKHSTPMRKKSIVDEIIPEFPTAIDLNVPEFV